MEEIAKKILDPEVVLAAAEAAGARTPEERWTFARAFASGMLYSQEARQALFKALEERWGAATEAEAEKVWAKRGIAAVIERATEVLGLSPKEKELIWEGLLNFIAVPAESLIALLALRGQWYPGWISLQRRALKRIAPLLERYGLGGPELEKRGGVGEL